MGLGAGPTAQALAIAASLGRPAAFLIIVFGVVRRLKPVPAEAAQ